MLISTFLSFSPTPHMWSCDSLCKTFEWFSLALCITSSVFRDHQRPICFSYSSSVSHPVLSNSLWSHGPWNSPGKNTGVDCHSLLQGIFLTQGSNRVSCIAGGFFTVRATGKPPLSFSYTKVFTIPSRRQALSYHPLFCTHRSLYLKRISPLSLPG